MFEVMLLASCVSIIIQQKYGYKSNLKKHKKQIMHSSRKYWNMFYVTCLLFFLPQTGCQDWLLTLHSSTGRSWRFCLVCADDIPLHAYIHFWCFKITLVYQMILANHHQFFFHRKQDYKSYLFVKIAPLTTALNVSCKRIVRDANTPTVTFMCVHTFSS